MKRLLVALLGKPRQGRARGRYETTLTWDAQRALGSLEKLEKVFQDGLNLFKRLKEV